MSDLGPRSPVTPVRPDRFEAVAEGTVLRPAGPATGIGSPDPMSPPAEGTVLRPAGPRATDNPAPGPTSPPGDGTVLRPAGPSPSDADAWAATSLTPPPADSWTPPGGPVFDQNDPALADQTMLAPPLVVPRADLGAADAGESRFAPPDDRPGVPDLQPPQERFAPLPVPGGPIDLPHGGRYSSPPPSQTDPEPRGPRRLPGWLLGVAVLLVVALVGGGIWWRFFRPVVVDVNITVPTSAAPVNKPKVEKPEDAVRGYLEALKAADITRALSYGPIGPGSQVLLSPNAVKDSQARAPIDNIVVPAVVGATSSVKARFTIGTEAVERSFNVTKTDDGGWQLAKSTTTVQLTAKRSPRVPLIINKTTVDNIAVLELVPGVYHFDTGLPFLRYLATTDLKVQSLDYNEPIQVLSLELTDEGRAALLERGQSSMNVCLDQPVLNPPNCPFGFNAPQQVTHIKWTAKKDPWSGVQFTLTKEDPAVAEANFTISLNAAVEYANGSRSDNNTYEGEVRLTADITKQRAQDITVQWSEARR